MIQECENDEPSIKRSAYVEEYLSNEDSSSDDDNQIDADEIKKLTAVIRRSNRVARPVYDSFIDQQVLLFHGLFLFEKPLFQPSYLYLKSYADLLFTNFRLAKKLFYKP